VGALAAAVLIPLSPLGSLFGFGGVPWQFWLVLVAIIAAYLTLVEVTKRWFDLREARRPEAVAREKVLTARRASASGG
jgi:fatty acid desaturase